MNSVSVLAFALILIHDVAYASQVKATQSNLTSVTPKPTPVATASPAQLKFSPTVKRDATQKNNSSVARAAKSDWGKIQNDTVSTMLHSMRERNESAKIKPYASLQPTPYEMSRKISTKGNGVGKFSKSEREGKSFVRSVGTERMIATITLESMNSATLLQNGVKVAQILDGNTSITTVCEVEAGDVIGVVAQGGGIGYFGVALSVHIKGACYATGSGQFRIRQAFGDKSWTKPGFNACAWDRPVPVGANHIGAVQRLSCHYCSERAAFVWGENCSPRTATFVRFAVGGDQCDNGSRSNSTSPGNSSGASIAPAPTASSDSAEEGSRRRKNRKKRHEVENESDDEDGKGRCRCRQAVGGNGGICYMFTGAVGRVQGQWKQVCEKRQCFISYECVDDGSYSHWCMWKIAKFRVLPIADGAVQAGRMFCRKVRLPVPQLFLIPYTS